MAGQVFGQVDISRPQVVNRAIGQPDLESLFREFYRTGGPEA